MDFKHLIEDKNGYTLLKLSGSLIEKHQADELLYDVEHHIINEANKFAIDLSELAVVNHTGSDIMFKMLTLARKSGGEAILFNTNAALETTEEGKRILEVFSTSENEFLAAGLLN